jgi:methionyl-tRNA formyltransferase
MNKKIIMLCSDCFSTVTLYNYISQYYIIDSIIAESPMRGLALAKRRIKKLGFIAVAGQVAFSVIILPLLRFYSKKRIAVLKGQYGFDETPLPPEKLTQFDTINDEACIKLLEELKPDIVIVNGTRIISAKMLNRVPSVFINMHAGITPKYRGVHGGYWALAENDNENCGVTIHLVDKGIDTGGILFQTKIETGRKDNFITYPYHQFGEGMPLIKKAIDAAAINSLNPFQHSNQASKLWYHPTIWQYLYLRIVKGKK